MTSVIHVKGQGQQQTLNFKGYRYQYFQRRELAQCKARPFNFQLLETQSDSNAFKR